MSENNKMTVRNSELNPFNQNQGGGQSLSSVTAAMATTRQAQEVQAAMIVAKRFPRNPAESMNRILDACTRKTLAENAMYSYPRGGQEVTGPSIRLAECVAQNWGNIDFGYIELEQKNGESQVMAYAWDLETNTRQSKVFSVPHRRDTKQGSYPITDSRDIYELVANQASRRVRSCILAVIPGDVIEGAVKQCELTLSSGDVPLEKRISDMVAKFSELGVDEEQLKGFIGKNVEAFQPQDVVRLAKIYRSIKDGVVGNDYFLNKLKESAPAVDPGTGEVLEAPKPEEKPKAKTVAKQPAGVKKQPGLDDL